VRTYRQDLEEISAVFPTIGPGERDALLWRGIVDICNENDLSFLIGEARIVTEAPYKEGTVSVTNGGTLVTVTGGVWAVWQQRKIKIQGRDEIYDVSIVNSMNTLTLAEPWLGETKSGLSYILFRDTYELPADCELTKELLLFDVTQRDQVDFVDYAEFRQAKAQAGGGLLGIPCAVARRGVNSSGRAEIEFGPRVPDSERVYQLDYFRSPQKPASLDASMNPTWPTAFEDVRVKRALYEYAMRKGHQRRFELKEQYEARIWDMVRKFDGGNEMRRRIRGTRSNTRRGLTITARWAG
jgi:hypothetical protein